MTAIHAAFAAIAHRLTGPDGLTFLLLWVVAIGSAVATYLSTRTDRQSLRGFFRHAIPPGTFSHPSARADILFWLSRHLVFKLLAWPMGLASAAIVGAVVHGAMVHVFGAPSRAPGHATPIELGLFTLTMLLAYDLSYYCYHFLQHKIPLLWELHKVHHSAEVMVGLTKDRIHPIDDIMNHLWDGLVPGLVYGLWLFFAKDPVELTLFGINVYVMRNVIMMDFVRHTHLKVSFGKVLNNIILCPHYHQLHHSINPKHYDKNFGLMLSVWDNLFGTLSRPAQNEDFAFGLINNEHAEYHSLSGLYLLPLKKIARMARRRIRHSDSEPVEAAYEQVGPVPRTAERQRAA